MFSFPLSPVPIDQEWLAPVPAAAMALDPLCVFYECFPPPERQVLRSPFRIAHHILFVQRHRGRHEMLEQKNNAFQDPEPVLPKE